MTSRDLSWLADRFVDETAGAHHAVVVSSDGLAIAASRGMDRASADRFAAVASGFIGLAVGTAGRMGGGSVQNVIVEMEHAWLFVSGISDGASLLVMADETCDVGRVAYEMAAFADKAAHAVTPALRTAAPAVP